MQVFWKTMRDNRRAWIGWTVALTAVAAMYASFYPSINSPAMADALNSFPQSLKEAFHMEDYTKPENYFAVSVFGLLVPILIAVFAISAGARAVAGDEEAGTLDLVQTQPVSRVSLALQRFLAIVVALVTVAAFMCLVVIALRGPGQFTALSPGRLFAICLQLALFGLLFAALAYGVGAWTGRRVHAIAVGAAVAVLGYLGDSFFTQIDSLKWTEKLSPFDWYLGGEPLKHGVQWGHAGLLLGLAVLFVAAGTWRYNQRDIAV
ncbi:ABC transporter permease subunit [Dactylosporangium cerinum]|uniref:ABC transporter permease subunit n=1 Tax=Dactylosporangium cerinum TaxID=1434730 RepID=A0ABV9WEA5_9ACTN